MKQVKKPGNRNVQPRRTSAAKEKAASAKTVFVWDAVIVAIAVIAFSPCLTGTFLAWDDYNYIRDNGLIRVFSAGNILHIFNFKTIVVGNYHPLTVLSYVIEYQLAGLSPFLYHFDNLLLHLFNICLFSWLMWLLTKKTNATIIATALFAVHPMRVESVVWAAERKDVLYAFFFLLSLIFYIRFLLKERQKGKYYFISVVFFILSILSKGQAVVLPLTLFLVDYWYKKKISMAAVLNKLPYLFLSLASGILAIMAQQSSLTEQRLMAHTYAERIAIAAFNIAAYLYKLVFPFNLTCFYKYPAVDDMLWVYMGALAAVVVIVLTAVYFRKNRTVVFGALFFLFTISIVTQILPVGNAIIADRYTYIPYIGLFFIAGVLLDRVIAGRPKAARYVLFMSVALLVVFTVKSYAQSMTWHDNVSLWKNALRHDPNNPVALTNLGHDYIEKEDYQTAIGLLKKAIENEATHPESFHAYQNLGVAHSRIGQDREAVKDYSAAFLRKPGYVDAIFSRGLAYTSMGKFDSAVADFTVIIAKLDSLHVQAYYSRGIALNKMGLTDQALADYNTAIRIDPGYSEPYMNRGNIWFSRNQYDAAIADYNSVIRLNPGYGSAYLNRSFAFFRANRYREALADALKAKDLKMEVPPQYIIDLQKSIK